MVGAVGLDFLVKEELLDLRIELVLRIKVGAGILVGVARPSTYLGNLGIGIVFSQFGGHVAGESGQHGAHVELTLTGNDLLLELLLVVKP